MGEDDIRRQGQRGNCRRGGPVRDRQRGSGGGQSGMVGLRGKVEARWFICPWVEAGEEVTECFGGEEGIPLTSMLS